jgi:hypothetical protein
MLPLVVLSVLDKLLSTQTGVENAQVALGQEPAGASGAAAAMVATVALRGTPESCRKVAGKCQAAVDMVSSRLLLFLLQLSSQCACGR